jgi:hypothetical protein
MRVASIGRSMLAFLGRMYPLISTRCNESPIRNFTSIADGRTDCMQQYTNGDRVISLAKFKRMAKARLMHVKPLVS